MTGNSANPSVAKLKKRIATSKGLFTRTETKLRSLTVKGNENVGNTLLEKLDTYAREVNDPVSYTHLTLPTIYSV